jgi:hypothetical protein
MARLVAEILDTEACYDNFNIRINYFLYVLLNVFGCTLIQLKFLTR